jgi:hypothetical protein
MVMNQLPGLGGVWREESGIGPFLAGAEHPPDGAQRVRDIPGGSVDRPYFAASYIHFTKYADSANNLANTTRD